MEDEKYRNVDGRISVDGLRRGIVDMEGWKRDGRVHLLKLTLFRSKPEPPLYRVEHRIIDDAGLADAHRELFDDVRLARNYFRRVRTDPPSRYKEAGWTRSTDSDSG